MFGIMAAPIKNLLAKGLSMENTDWFGEEGLTEDEVCFFVLGKGDALVLPFGYAFVYVHATKDGSLERRNERKISKGKMIVQWNLQQLKLDGTQAPVLALLKVNFDTIKRSKGSVSPWSIVIGKVCEWLGEVTTE